MYERRGEGEGEGKGQRERKKEREGRENLSSLICTRRSSPNMS